jgi:hypothetical protein
MTMLDKEKYAKFYDNFRKGRASFLNLPGISSAGVNDSSLNHKTMKSYSLSAEELKSKTNIAKWAKITFTQPIHIKPYPTGKLS